ncbi:hypothetical protein P1A145kb_p080 [Pectobacterium phage DU_PP_I]|nr:hypothetical protein P1A145kb_p080 [Pectobacterium phage DU_PP_I]ATS93797.1 hypothetical protein P12B145kb_p081 [Pectobacterium phage DU_PP_IV]
MEGKSVFLVSSDAGYGQSVRAKVDDPQAATLKASRLAKKGHTNIEISEAKIIGTTKFEAEA